MTDPPICPTCGRAPRAQISPVDQVVTGEADRDTAPLLYEAWDVIQVLTRAMHGRPVRRQDLVAQVMTLTGCAENTAGNLIAAGVRAGYLSREYRIDGTPRRQRCYLTWRRS